MINITGGCFCGTIRYAITANEAFATVCHCAGCRKASGAPAVAWITVQAAEFRLTQGEPRTVRGMRDVPHTCDSHGGTRGFCPNCGTHLTYEGDGQPTIDITTGSLDDPHAFPPQVDVLGDQKVAWMKTLA
jgi:hypothetical protein